MEMVITENNFEEEVLKSEIPVLVDFYADWCENCKEFAVVIEEIAQESKDVKFCMIDTSKEEQISCKYNIDCLPTLIVFKKGRVAAASEGVVSKEEVLKLIRS